MRTIFLAMLFAGTASQAMAAADERTERRAAARAEASERAAERKQQRAQRSERRDERKDGGNRGEQRQEREDRGMRAQPAAARAEPEQVQRERPQQRRTPVAVERRVERATTVPGENERNIRSQREPRQGRDSVRDWRAADRRRADSPSAIEERNLRVAPRTGRSGGNLVEQTRPLPQVLDRDPTRVASRRPRPDVEAPEPSTARLAHARPSHRWRTDWRRDRRFNWSDHRRRHRSQFRLAIYIDPFGWNYRRYGIGWRMWPSHYSHRYWLSDPWSYRLPPAYGPYRWVRYWDDALLVNIYTGQVVDVVHNFFW